MTGVDPRLAVALDPAHPDRPQRRHPALVLLHRVSAHAHAAATVALRLAGGKKAALVSDKQKMSATTLISRVSLIAWIFGFCAFHSE